MTGEKKQHPNPELERGVSACCFFGRGGFWGAGPPPIDHACSSAFDASLCHIIQLYRSPITKRLVETLVVVEAKV